MVRLSQVVKVFALLLVVPQLWAAENLVLNPDLNYKKNGYQGPLITADNMGDGLVPDKPNYIIFYAGFCYNAKRQARRTVHLYEKYRDRVHFVIVDLSRRAVLSPEQQELAKGFFTDTIPVTVIIDKTGKVVFNYTGEAEEETLEGWLNSTLW